MAPKGALGIFEELDEPEDADTAWECLERWESPIGKIIAAPEDLIFDVQRGGSPPRTEKP
ncbi:hypothetical protein GCM10022224_088790 [Nonomuraea antimicrobica]|uniref:Uncharacterized protein n=1 Tax=Nonomuraea antimicrobica TaxID=561173 RepID=A0ABP7DV18_9ACTN